MCYCMLWLCTTWDCIVQFFPSESMDQGIWRVLRDSVKLQLMWGHCHRSNNIKKRDKLVQLYIEGTQFKETVKAWNCSYCYLQNDNVRVLNLINKTDFKEYQEPFIEFIIFERFQQWDIEVRWILSTWQAMNPLPPLIDVCTRQHCMEGH